MSGPRVLFDNIAILIEASATRSEGGVDLPDNVVDADKPRIGVVSSVGRLVEEVKPGDRVTVTAYVGTELQHEDGRTYVIARERNVLVVNDPVSCQPSTSSSTPPTT